MLIKLIVIIKFLLVVLAVYFIVIGYLYITK